MTDIKSLLQFLAVRNSTAGGNIANYVVQIDETKFHYRKGVSKKKY